MPNLGRESEEFDRINRDPIDVQGNFAERQLRWLDAERLTHRLTSRQHSGPLDPGYTGHQLRRFLDLPEILDADIGVRLHAGKKGMPKASACARYHCSAKTIEQESCGNHKDTAACHLCDDEAEPQAPHRRRSSGTVSLKDDQRTVMW